MTRNPIAATFTLAATLLVAGTAAAAGPANAEYYPFTDSTALSGSRAFTGSKALTDSKAMVKTTDKADAPAAVVKATADTSTRKMGAQTGIAIPDQSREIEMYLKAGG